jgi:hypothetical protein
MDLCATDHPPLLQVGDQHHAACLRAGRTSGQLAEAT